MHWKTALIACVLVATLQPTPAHAQVCGDATQDNIRSALDVLVILRAAVGVGGCDLCICDTNGDGALGVNDALCFLRLVVGLQCPLACEDCGASICGDGEVPPITGPLLDSTVLVDNCLLLDVGGGDIEDDIDVTLRKALNADLAPVAGATTSVDNRGCDCFELVASANGTRAPSFARSDGTAGPATTTTNGSSTTSSSLYTSCNCYVAVYVEASEPLAVAEVAIALRDGDCDSEGFGLVEIVRVDAGVEEECDDGNAVASDGCSEVCLLEVE